MQKSYQVGDKVEHEYLGVGIVTEVLHSSLDKRYNSFVVRFETDPPVDYNLGRNPAIVCIENIRKVIDGNFNKKT